MQQAFLFVSLPHETTHSSTFIEKVERRVAATWRDMRYDQLLTFNYTLL